MHTIKIESLDTIRQAAKEFIAGMDDRTVFAFRGNMGAGKTIRPVNLSIILTSIASTN